MNYNHNYLPASNRSHFHSHSPYHQQARVQFSAPPPPPLPQATQFNNGAHQDVNHAFSPNQYRQHQNGNYRRAGGQSGNRSVPYSHSGFNRQSLADQESLVCHQLATGDIIKNLNKLLEEKDRQIDELRADKEALSQKNDNLSAELLESGNLEAKKQDLDLQELSLELEIAEIKKLREDIKKLEEQVNLWGKCYQHDIDAIIEEYRGRLNLSGIPDTTSFREELSVMALQRSENDKLKEELEKFKLEAENQAQLAKEWEMKYNELKKEW